MNWNEEAHRLEHIDESTDLEAQAGFWSPLQNDSHRAQARRVPIATAMRTINSSRIFSRTDMAGLSVLTNAQTLRQPARAQIEDGAVTAGSNADRKTVLKMLNNSLATEIVCVLRYRHHHFMARGIHAQFAAEVFLGHSNDEQRHADLIAERIVQLGGEPNFSPEGLVSRSYAEYVEGVTLSDNIRKDLVAERIAIDSYRDLIQYLGDQDPTTRQLLESILAVEEGHADALADLLQVIPTESKTATLAAVLKA